MLLVRRCIAFGSVGVSIPQKRSVSARLVERSSIDVLIASMRTKKTGFEGGKKWLCNAVRMPACCLPEAEVAPPCRLSAEQYWSLSRPLLNSKEGKTHVEKIELNKRTLRALSMTEISLVAGADAEDGDAEEPAPPKTVVSECACPTDTVMCPIPLSDPRKCPATADTRCCPVGSD